MAAVAMIYHNKQLQNLQSNKFKSQELSGRQKREGEMADKLMNDMRGHDPRQTETPLTRFQRVVRSNLISSTRLHRKNLAERLRFDVAVVRGTARLLNQLSSNEQLKRGIFQDLESSFDFAWIKSISSRDQFVSEGLPLLAEQSKQYFILSSAYFDAGGGGSVMLLQDMEVFSQPKPTIVLNLQAPSFSFVAWVSTSSQFVDGYILRKRVSSAGIGAGLTCWGWFLHSSEGAGFHFGGHDYYNTGGAAQGSQQVEIGLQRPAAVPAEQDMMLTMTVTESHVTFYRDLTEIGQRELPRVPTDCFNNGDSILVGDSGLMLGMVRFYPRALTLSGITELHTAGGQLADISTASAPPYVNASRMDSLERTLAGRLDSVEELVGQRGPQSEVGQVLQAVEEMRLNPAPGETLVSAPLGKIQVKQTVKTDPLTGRGYTQVVDGPWYLSKTEQDQDHRTLHGLPSFVGTGMTITMWYRHVPCEMENCGVYLFVARNEAAYCWSFWLENTAWYFDNVKGTPKFQYPRNFVDAKFNLNGNTFWRHIAMVMDEVTDNVRWYLDGELAWEGPWGSAVSEADCNAVQSDGSDKYVTLGRAEPGYTYGDDAQLYDVRMYVHPNGSPLTGAEVMAISRAPTPGLDASLLCLPITSDLMADTDWRDSWGHGCEWYFANAQTNPTICEYPPAKLQCPIGCGSRQECLSHSTRKVFFTWDRVRRIERQMPNGTLCLNADWSPAQVVAQCREWVAAGRPDSVPGGIKGWLESLDVGRTGTRIDVRDCDVLASAIDESCSFDAEQIRHFTRGVHASGGDFTVAFWVKPIGPISKLPARDQFIPHLQFLSTLSPPTHNLVFGSWANPNGEARLYSSCASGKRDENENVELKAAEADGWTMVSISRQNYSKVGAVESGEMFVTTNMLRNWEGTFLPQCLYDDTSFFNALEVNYPMLISPIMLVPQAIPFAEIQQTYFQFAEAMKVKGGPLVSNAKRIEQQHITVEKRNFGPRSALMAPPIIFQQRAKPADACPFEYSDKLQAQQHAQMVKSKCDDSVLSDSRHTIACPGSPMREGTHFEVPPMDLRGNRGYPELLYSITDNPFLWRNGRLTDTVDFVDVLTENVEVVFVFFTPTFGITSVMTVLADFSGSLAANVDVQLAHYEIIEGESLGLYMFAQIVVLASIGFMIMDIVLGCRETIKEARCNGGWPDASRIFKTFTDSAIAVMVIVFIAYRIPSKRSSAGETDRILGSLGEIPWDSVEKTLQEKLELFFASVVDLMSLIEKESTLSDFCNIILVVSLFRVIQCTSLHPRLALLTGTLIKAADDLWHATLLIVMLMCCFASIATWRFGSQRPDFATFELSMQTQFMMTFGEFPENWNETTDLQLYTVLYFMLVFLLVQNFLLAIIVEAFIKVREDNNELQTEQEFTSDVAASVAAHLHAAREQWPNLNDLGLMLEQWNAKYSVGFKELWSTGKFKTHRSVHTFLKFYSGFEFLQPPTIKKRPPAKKGDEMTESLMRDFADLMGVSIPTLKEEAEENLSKASLRRELKASMKANAKANDSSGVAVPAASDLSGMASPPRTAWANRKDSFASAPELNENGSGAFAGINGGSNGHHDVAHPNEQPPPSPEQVLEQRESGPGVNEHLRTEAASTLAPDLQLESMRDGEAAQADAGREVEVREQAALAAGQGEVTAQLEAMRSRLLRMENKVEEDSRNIKQILRLLESGATTQRDKDLDLPGSVP